MGMRRAERRQENQDWQRQIQHEQTNAARPDSAYVQNYGQGRRKHKRKHHHRRRGQNMQQPMNPQ